MTPRRDDLEHVDPAKLRKHPWLTVPSFITWILTTIVSLCTIFGFVGALVINYAYPRLKGEGLELMMAENFKLVRTDLSRVERKIDKI